MSDQVNYQHPPFSDNRDVEELLPLIKKELDQLNHIYEQASFFSHNDEKYFAKLFPKTCHNCQLTYHNRSEYLLKTTAPSGGSLVFLEGGLKELRLCSCGASLTLWSENTDRRDSTYLGFLRRVLFENCLRKLGLLRPEKNEHELKQYLRTYFSK
ncbi:MAG: hypothetical protein OXC40_03845 [Proteobacteria bacterium]|nr:hypothetical protein [Pseudomonadota bacterium]